MPGSRDKVLHTPELLEAVLGSLDIRTLLTSAQLVSRAWHSLITHSPSLQRALYFRPDDGGERLTSTNAGAHDAEGDLGLNPLLAEVFPSFFQPFRPCRPRDVPSNNDNAVDGTSSSSQQQHRPEGSLRRRDTATSTTTTHASDAFPALPAPIVMSTFHSLPRSAALMRPGASWRRMLVRNQPPAQRLGRCHKCVSSHGDTCYEYDGVDLSVGGSGAGGDGGAGLRMGELYDLVQDWTARVPEGRGCRVFWEPEAYLDVLRRSPGGGAWGWGRGRGGGRPVVAEPRALIEARREMTECVDVVVEVVSCWSSPGEVWFVSNAAGGEGRRDARGREEEAERERLGFDRRFRHPEAELLMALPESVVPHERAHPHDYAPQGPVTA